MFGTIFTLIPDKIRKATMTFVGKGGASATKQAAYRCTFFVGYSFHQIYLHQAFTAYSGRTMGISIIKFGAQNRKGKFPYRTKTGESAGFVRCHLTIFSPSGILNSSSIGCTQWYWPLVSWFPTLHEYSTEMLQVWAGYPA